MTEPTNRGRQEFDPDGIYGGQPCTCEPECPIACKGYPPTCKSKQPGGCLASQHSYADFLSSE
jgi:hypothetical protein